MPKDAAAQKTSTSRHAAGRNWLPRVTIVLVVIVALLGVASFAQMRDIERGLLSVTADQQDQYVQLVVRQINLKENRNDRQMVNQILGSIDGSGSQYWTFSRDDTMVYVKDVTETNKYKGLPTSSYFSQGEAADFYNSLSSDQVQHAYVDIDGTEYIASGQAFSYKHSTYRLVLLTNESVVLDNNQVLGARSRLGALLGIEAALLLFTGVWLAAQRDREHRRYRRAQEDAAHLTGVTERLNAYIARQRTYDAARRLWNMEAIGQFADSLAKRHKQAWLATADFGVAGTDGSAATENRKAFEDRLQVLADRDAACFSDGSKRVSVLFLRDGESEARSRFAHLLGSLPATVDWRLVGEGDADPEPEDESETFASTAEATEATVVTATAASGAAAASSAAAEPNATAKPDATSEPNASAGSDAANTESRPHGTARIRDNETKRKWERERERRTTEAARGERSSSDEGTN